MINKTYERSNYLRSFLINSYGRIAEIFRHSLNVEFGNHYLHIGGGELGLTAFGISLPIDDVFQIIKDNEVNNRVLYRDGKLIFYGNTRVFKYDLNSFKDVDLKILPQKIRKVSLLTLKETLQNMKVDQKIGLDIHYMAEIEPLILNPSQDNFNSLVKKLSGRGKGLTPSGDDMLVGMLMILTSLSGEENQMEALRSSLRSPNHGNTTNVSKNYIYSAVNGYFSEDLKLLSKMLDCNDAKEFERMVGNVLLMGHTSGHDTMMGIYLALTMVLGGKKDDK